MKKYKKHLTTILFFVFVVSLNSASACSTCGDNNTSNNVNSIVKSITLSGSDKNISWIVDGYSTKGFKVVWSKNSEPTYPTRSGDKYHYFSNPNKINDILSTFNGDGIYYVRVCEYLGGKCGIYSNEIKIILNNNTNKEDDEIQIIKEKIKDKLNNSVKKEDKEIQAIKEKAKDLSENKLDIILSELKELRNLVKEQQNQITHLKRLLSGVASVTEKMQNSITSFITYGVDENTKNLGEGERAAVMYSYKNAFGKLPSNEDELTDAIKIANGRWPSNTNKEAEDKAKEKFREIYKREANSSNIHDNAAIVIMSYGLRQRAENRNLISERNGLRIFKDIYNKMPETTEEWNILQAIVYSGSTK